SPTPPSSPANLPSLAPRKDDLPRATVRGNGIRPARRSYNMSRIRGKDTKPEMLVRRFLHAQRFRFRLHKRGLPGTPDLVLPKYGAILFVHGCFWHVHDCPLGAVRPKT